MGRAGLEGGRTDDRQNDVPSFSRKFILFRIRDYKKLTYVYFYESIL
jgi:hypothetical protein